MESCEAKSYIELANQLYAEAFSQGDIEGMMETSSDLGLAYAALGLNALSEKWTDEYLHLALGAAMPHHA
ncbi:MAG TPA: hypothetical protein DCZ95_01065 [Verrucomicrobia bacterium]|nr:MAG: hypothetical protein A2X46_00885 [Lentisphaerae bacterium GWF2_57_35]HBA82658.1 hypothetical protein [Verrucomicrobiota bacterium]